jgi:hypothetical protein
LDAVHGNESMLRRKPAMNAMPRGHRFVIENIRDAMTS